MQPRPKMGLWHDGEIKLRIKVCLLFRRFWRKWSEVNLKFNKCLPSMLKKYIVSGEHEILCYFLF